MNSQDAHHSVSVAGVITDNHGRVLLIQRRDNHQWEPLGGVLEPGETIHHGLRREVREETGLDVEPVALTGVYKNMTRAIIALVFRCKITGGDLITTDEVAALRWASGADVAGLADEAYAIRVLDARNSGQSKASYGSLPTTTPRRKPSDKGRLAPAPRPCRVAESSLSSDRA